VGLGLGGGLRVSASRGGTEGIISGRVSREARSWTTRFVSLQILRRIPGLKMVRKTSVRPSRHHTQADETSERLQNWETESIGAKNNSASNTGFGAVRGARKRLYDISFFRHLSKWVNYTLSVSVETRQGIQIPNSFSNLNVPAAQGMKRIERARKGELERAAHLNVGRRVTKGIRRRRESSLWSGGLSPAQQKSIRIMAVSRSSAAMDRRSRDLARANCW
jgi:hypothetical protein